MGHTMDGRDSDKIHPRNFNRRSSFLVAPTGPNRLAVLQGRKRPSKVPADVFRLSFVLASTIEEVAGWLAGP